VAHPFLPSANPVNADTNRTLIKQIAKILVVFSSQFLYLMIMRFYLTLFFARDLQD
jgi:hypothetical protein